MTTLVEPSNKVPVEPYSPTAPSSFMPKDVTKDVTSDLRFKGLCPSVIRGEPCRFQKRGICHYALHDEKKTVLRVAPVPHHMRWQQVKDIFKEYGSVVHVHTKAMQGRHNVAFVHFRTKEEAAMTVQVMKGQTPIGCSAPLDLRYATPEEVAEYRHRERRASSPAPASKDEARVKHPRRRQDRSRSRSRSPQPQHDKNNAHVPMSMPMPMPMHMYMPPPQQAQQGASTGGYYMPYPYMPYMFPPQMSGEKQVFGGPYPPHFMGLPPPPSHHRPRRRERTPSPEPIGIYDPSALPPPEATRPYNPTSPGSPPGPTTPPDQEPPSSSRKSTPKTTPKEKEVRPAEGRRPTHSTEPRTENTLPVDVLALSQTVDALHHVLSSSVPRAQPSSTSTS